MCEGDEWKNGDKPMASPHDMRKFLADKTRVLLDINGYENIVETCIIEVSPDGEYSCIAGGFGGGNWVRTSDCQVLALLPPRYYRKDNKLTKDMLDQIYQDMKGDDTNE